MSINKYIIQNCSNSKRYRITIDGTSHLSVGETWNIECDVIENGCYQILKDDSNVKLEVNVDDCSFIEYGTCYQCEEDNKPINQILSSEIGCETCDPSYTWSAYSDCQCYTILTQPVIPPSQLLSTENASFSVYTQYGTKIYTTTDFPLDGSGSTDTYITIDTYDIWDNPNSYGNVGPLNRCAIWVNDGISTGTDLPINTWVGFSTCLTGVTETKQYYVGIAGDNHFRLVLDGEDIVNTRTSPAPFDQIGNDQYAFKFWYVYPVEIGQGSHTLELYGYNKGNAAGFGCEIYDATIEQLTGATTIDELNIIYSSSGQTEITVFQNQDGEYLSSGYTCPSGYVYSTCGDDCVQYQFCNTCVTPTTTPTISVTQSVTPTPSITPTNTPSEPSGVRVPTNAYVALLYDCNGNGPYEFAIETNYYDDIISPTNISWYFEHSDGNCYELTFPFNVNTTETVNAETPEWSNVYIGPSEMQINSCCDIGDCVSATTVGSYMFTDCCGIARAGNSINETFCVDTSLFYEGLNLTNSSCVQQCDEGPLSVVYSATSSCNRPGSIYIEVAGGTQPYNVQNITPGTLPSQTGLGPFEYSNIPEGTYVFNIFDSTLPESRQTALTVVISDCLETTITSSNIDCEGGLGTITVSGSSESYPIIYQLYRYGGLYNTITANNNTTTFINLPEGEYYCVVTDSLFESNQTDTVTIEDDSNNIEFDLLITGDSQCGLNTGAAQVTNITGGPPPFTYLWSNGQTGDTITGLTVGSYTVTVVDSKGCQKIQNFNINAIPSLGVSRILSTQPTCFDCDGDATVIITGGTPPYTFSGTTGQVQQGGSEFTMSGLCGGFYQISIEDSANCSIVQNISLESTAGFTVVGVNTTEADCGENGQIEITVQGTLGLIMYSITGSTGITETVTKYGQSHIFNNLPIGTYTVEISDKDRDCVYTTEVVIRGIEKFTIETTTSGTTCGLDNGSVIIDVLSGSTSIEYPLTYEITRVSDGQVLVTYSSVNSNSQLITDIPEGSYQIQVTDNSGCVVTEYFQIISLYKGIEAVLYGTNCINGNDGTATLLIYNGTPPYTINWSNGVTGQQNLSGLSGGTYTVTVEDDNGCIFTNSVDIECDVEIIDDYVLNTVCEEVFETGESGIKSFEDILYESYLEAIINGQNCDFNWATWSACLTISGASYSGSAQHCEYDFYYSDNLQDVPTPELWAQIVEQLLQQFPDISWVVDLENNTYTITSTCDGEDDPLKGAFVELSLFIRMDVDCQGQRPQPTPSITPTPSVTPPVFDCELVVIGEGRELSCGLIVVGSAREIDCLLDVDTSVRDLSCDLGIISKI